MLSQLSQLASVVKVEGWQTASTPQQLGLVKDKLDKSKAEFAAHAVLVAYQPPLLSFPAYKCGGISEVYR
ncbi:MAG: hypothetical protein ACKO24_19205 [Leptolyngbyaceae cyanobacterium]